MSAILRSQLLPKHTIKCTTPADPPLSPISDRAQGRRLVVARVVQCHRHPEKRATNFRGTPPGTLYRMYGFASASICLRTEASAGTVPCYCTYELPRARHRLTRRPPCSATLATRRVACSWIRGCSAGSAALAERGGVRGDRRDEIGPGDALLLAVCKHAIKCCRGVC